MVTSGLLRTFRNRKLGTESTRRGIMRKSMRRSSIHLATRQAFTLVELMVAMAITLVLVYAIAEFYAYVGASVRDGRAMIEMSGQLRSVNFRLRQDLNSLTVRVKPPVDPGVSAGYFEIIESSRDNDNDGSFDTPGAWDGDPEGNGIDFFNSNGINDLVDDGNGNGIPDAYDGPNLAPTLIGDGDDVLAMTISSSTETYQARFLTTDTITPVRIQESHQAEVVWFTGFVDADGDNVWSAGEPRYLVRRVLPIVVTNQQLPLVSAAPTYFQQYDISVRIGYDSVAGENRWYPNTLYDLTNPENRFCHQNVQGIAQMATSQRLPGPCVVRPYNSASVSFFTLQGDRYGEDIMMQNLLAFDVRVWDPLAPLVANADGSSGPITSTLSPSDPGFVAACLASASGNPTLPSGNPIVGVGAYVDLGYTRYLEQANPSMANWLNYDYSNNSQAQVAFQLRRGKFGGLPNTAVAGAVAGTPLRTYQFYGPVYDTWTTSYERDGIDQWPMLGSGTDMMTNGLDDDGINGPDDPGERETQAPYPYQVRGIQVRIRMYEPASRQAKQVTVGMDFIEE